MRSQISAPVALISTTNMLSYEAPDIFGTPRIANPNVSSSNSVTSRSSSGEESDASSASVRSRDTLTDASSVDDSYSPMSPEPNHLSCYFKPSTTTTDSRTSTASSNPSTFDSPSIPQRAPSHSKKAHVQLSRQRSVMRSNENSRDSFDMFAQDNTIEAPVSHPFGKELEQLNEVAEEFGSVVRDAEADADRAVMQAKGLLQICANDYMQEIAGFYTNVFAEDAMTFQQVAWI